jgi:hypothetical protein
MFMSGYYPLSLPAFTYPSPMCFFWLPHSRTKTYVIHLLALFVSRSKTSLMVKYCSLSEETRFAQPITLCLTMDLDHNLPCQVSFAKEKEGKKQARTKLS